MRRQTNVEIELHFKLNVGTKRVSFFKICSSFWNRMYTFTFYKYINIVLSGSRTRLVLEFNFKGTKKKKKNHTTSTNYVLPTVVCVFQITIDRVRGVVI